MSASPALVAAVINNWAEIVAQLDAPPQRAPSTDQFLTTAQVAELLQVSRHTLKGWRTNVFAEFREVSS